MKKRLTSYIKYPEVIDQLCHETYNTVSSTTLEDLIYYQLFGEYQEIQNIMLQLYTDEKSLAEAAIDVLDFFYFNFPDDRLSLKHLFGCVMDMVSTAEFPKETVQKREYISKNIDEYSIEYIRNVLEKKAEYQAGIIKIEKQIEKNVEQNRSDKEMQASTRLAELTTAIQNININELKRMPEYYFRILMDNWELLYDNPNVCQVYESILSLAEPINDSSYMRKEFREAVLDHINYHKARKIIRMMKLT